MSTYFRCVLVHTCDSALAVSAQVLATIRELRHEFIASAANAGVLAW